MTQPGNPPIVIVGAGVAGLTAAYRLAQAGVDVSLYEANAARIGGRCWTATNFGHRGLGEHGAERIDSRHQDVLELVAELGLRLEDHSIPNGLHTLIRTQSGQESIDEHLAGRAELKSILETDLQRRGIQLTSSRRLSLSTAERELDRMSIREWVRTTVPGGVGSPAARTLLDSMAQLHGLEPADLSAYLLLEDYDLVFADYIDVNDNQTHLKADDRWRIAGGNDQLVTALAARLPRDSIVLGRSLTALKRHGSQYSLTFADGSSVVADYVILALPFSTLRRVDLDGSGFTATKRATIADLAYGVCAKLLLQFDKPVAGLRNWSGTLLSDRPRFQSFCSSSSADTSIVTAYFGAAEAANLSVTTAHGPAPASVVDPIIDAFERAVPGARDAFTGQAWLDAWVDDEHVGAAYSTLRPGHAASHRHVAYVPEYKVSFAGEHTSINHRGYLNGAVESGTRAANEVLAHLDRS